MRISVAGIATATLVCLTGVGADAVIADDAYFFGQSPPVYPSPQAVGHGPWANAFASATKLVKQMTLEEKLNLTVGVKPQNGCAGVIPPVNRLGFPGMCLHDAGHGVHHTTFVSSWPSNIHVGASWNKNLALKRAEAMGGEFKRKGVNVMLGPAIGPLGRVVTGGRNWEGFSIDPYLSGALVHQTVAGVQGVGVITSTKHYIGNEQETDRSPSEKSAAVSSNIDDVTMHELYLWPFQDAVKAGTGNIMCSYQRLNNSYGCQNSKALNGLLKHELGFQGFVLTDWNALYTGVAAALAGLDMAMPDGGRFWGAKLSEAIKNGSVPESRLDDMAVRIVSSWYQMSQDKDFPKPGSGLPFNLALSHQRTDARKPEDKPVLFNGAVEGHVLVKNINNALPLRKPQLLSVLGYSATAPAQNMVGNPGPSTWNVGFQAGNATQIVAALADIAKGIRREIPVIANGGTLLSGGGSGATSQSTFLAPFDALIVQADQDGTQLFWDFKSENPEVVGSSDACLVFGNAFASEAFDRTALRDDFTDNIITNVASKCSNTIVILHNAGIRLVDPWINHPNVTAVIFAHLPGQETGKALISLLYGRENFSGKLPYTVAKNQSNYGPGSSPSLPEGQFLKFPQSNFSEGVYVDYRHFDRKGINPRFEFGFGLSYTTFAFTNLQIRTLKSNVSEFPSGAIAEGGQVDLWDVVVVVTADVRNTGGVTGAEVAQLYIGISGAPEKQLRGFEKVKIRSGDTVGVEFRLTRRDLSVWDVRAQKWRLQKGSFKIQVGNSSRSLPLKGEVRL